MKPFYWIFVAILCMICRSEMNAVTVITSIPTGGMTINTPGLYVLGNDITWTPSGDGQAIKITTGGVVLDLQNHILASTTTSFNTTGIYALACANLTIKNGTIANMGLEGIKCELSSYIMVDNITIDGLNLNNIVTYTVPVGILITESASVTVQNCTVKNLDVTTGSLAGIQFTATAFSFASNCLIQNLINRDGACTGIGHALCTVANVTGCTISNLTSEFVSNLNTEGHTAIGIIPTLSSYVTVKDCVISNITGCCDDAHGMSLFECLYGTVKRCKVSNVLDGTGAAQTGAKATGIEIYASNVDVIKCKVKNISAINPQDKQAAGFSCAQCTNVQFKKCQAKNVNVYDANGNQSAALGYGVGFGWAPDPRPAFNSPATNILYDHCTAQNCQVGFDSWYHVHSVWKHIYSICNGISILNEPHAQRTISCDPCSECGCTNPACYPNPLVVTLTNIAADNTFKHVHTQYCQSP